MNTGIYEIVNLANGHRYVGQSSNLKRRFTEHRSLLRIRKSKHVILQNAWSKHGEPAFVFRTILVCEKRHLSLYEQRCIDGLAPEYNARPVADSMLGFKHSQEFRDNQHKRMLGNTRGVGYKHTDEVRNKQRRRMIGNKIAAGKVPTPEHREKNRIAQLGNKRTLGYSPTKECREKLRIRMIGNTHSVGKNLGNKHTLGMKLGPQSPEQIRMRVESRKITMALRKSA